MFVRRRFFGAKLTAPVTFDYRRSREVLLKGTAQYSWPPCTNQFRTALFNNENIIYQCYKRSYVNEEVKCTDPSPSASVPWSQHLVKDGKNIKNKSVGFILRRRDIHFNDNRQNDIQQNGFTLQNVLLTVLAMLHFLYCYAEYRYAACQRYAERLDYPEWH